MHKLSSGGSLLPPLQLDKIKNIYEDDLSIMEMNKLTPASKDDGNNIYSSDLESGKVGICNYTSSDTGSIPQEPQGSGANLVGNMNLSDINPRLSHSTLIPINWQYSVDEKQLVHSYSADINYDNYFGNNVQYSMYNNHNIDPNKSNINQRFSKIRRFSSIPKKFTDKIRNTLQSLIKSHNEEKLKDLNSGNNMTRDSLYDKKLTRLNRDSNNLNNNSSNNYKTKLEDVKSLSSIQDIQEQMTLDHLEEQLSIRSGTSSLNNLRKISTCNISNNIEGSIQNMEHVPYMIVKNPNYDIYPEIPLHNMKPFTSPSSSPNFFIPSPRTMEMISQDQHKGAFYLDETNKLVDKSDMDINLLYNEYNIKDLKMDNKEMNNSGIQISNKTHIDPSSNDNMVIPTSGSNIQLESCKDIDFNQNKISDFSKKYIGPSIDTNMYIFTPREDKIGMNKKVDYLNFLKKEDFNNTESPINKIKTKPSMNPNLFITTPRKPRNTEDEDFKEFRSNKQIDLDVGICKNPKENNKPLQDTSIITDVNKSRTKDVLNISELPDINEKEYKNSISDHNNTKIYLGPSFTPNLVIPTPRLGLEVEKEHINDRKEFLDSKNEIRSNKIIDQKKEMDIEDTNKDEDIETRVEDNKNNVSTSPLAFLKNIKPIVHSKKLKASNKQIINKNFNPNTIPILLEEKSPQLNSSSIHIGPSTDPFHCIITPRTYDKKQNEKDSEQNIDNLKYLYINKVSETHTLTSSIYEYASIYNVNDNLKEKSVNKIPEILDISNSEIKGNSDVNIQQLVDSNKVIINSRELGINKSVSSEDKNNDNILLSIDNSKIYKEPLITPDIVIPNSEDKELDHIQLKKEIIGKQKDINSKIIEYPNIHIGPSLDTNMSIPTSKNFISSKQNVYKEPSTYIPKIYIGPSYTPNFFIRNFRGQLDNEIIEQGNSAINNKSQKQFDQMFVRPSTNPYLSILTPRKLNQVDKQLSPNIINLKNISDVELNSKSEENNSETKINLSDIENSQNKEEITNINKAIETNNISNRSNLLKLKAENSKSRKYQGIESNKLVFDDYCNKIEKKSDSVNVEADNKSLNPVNIDTNIKSPDSSRLKPTEIKEPGFFDIIQRAIFGNSEYNESKQKGSNKKSMKHKQIKIKPGIHLGVSCNPYFSFLPQNQSIKLDEVPEIVIDSEILLSNNKSVNNTTNFINNNEISATENSSEVLKKENLDIKEPFNKKVLNIDKSRDLKYIKAIDNVETETREYSSKISGLLDNQKKGIDTSMSFKIHTGPSAAPNFAITTHIEKKKLTDEDLRVLEVKISETDKTVKTDTKYDVLSSVLNPIVPCVTKAQYDHKLGELPEKIHKVQGIIQKMYFGPSCTPNFAIPTLSHIEIPEESLKSIEIKTSDYFSLLVNEKPNLKISLNPLPLQNLEKNEDVTVAMNSKDHIFSKIIHKNSDLKNVTSPLNLRTLHSQATETFINDPKNLIRDDSKVQINTSLKSKSGIYIGPSTVPNMMIPTPRKLERDYSKDNMDNLVTKKKSLDFKPLIYKEQNQNDYSKDLNIPKEYLERSNIKENPDFCKAKRNNVILPTFPNLATKGIEKSNNSDEVSKTLMNSDRDQKILFGPSDKIKSAYSETSKANICGHMENTQAEEKQQNIEYPKLSEDKSRNTIIFDNSKLLVKDDKSNIAVDFKPENKFKKDLDTRMKILSHNSNTISGYLRDETKIETLSNVNTKALAISEKSKRSLNLDEINRTNSKKIKKFLNKTEGELKYKEKLPSMKGDGNLSCNSSLATLTSKDHDEKKCSHEKKKNMIEKHKVVLHNVEITDKEQVESQRNVIQEYLIDNRSSKSTINLPTFMQINSMYIGPSTDPNFIIPTPRKDSHNLASNLKLMKVSPGIYIGPSANPNFMFRAPGKQSPSIELYPINSIQRESPIAGNLSFTHTPYGYCSFPIRDYVIPVYPNSELVNKEIYEPNLVHTLSYGGPIAKSSFFEPFRSYTSPDGSFSAYKKIPIQTDTKVPMNNFVKLLSNNIDNLISNKPNIMETGKLCKSVQTKSTETLTDDSSIQSRRTKLILRKCKTMNCNLTSEVDNKSELNDPNIKDQFFPNKFEPLVEKKENSSRFQDFSFSSIVKNRKDFENDEVRSQIKCLSCSKIKEIQDLGLGSYPLNSNVLLKPSNIGSNSIKFSNVLSSNQSKLSALDILFSTDFSQPPHKQYAANKNNKLSISSNQERNKVLNTIKRKNLNNLYIPIISKDYIKKMGNKHLNKNNFCYQGNTSTNINNKNTAVYNSFNNFPKNVVSLSNTTPYKELNCNINLKPDKILTMSDIPIDNLFKECQTNGNFPNTSNNSQENRSLKTFQISNMNSVVLNQTPTILTPLVTDSNPNRSPVSPQNLLPRKNIPKLDRFYDMYGVIRAKNKIRKRMNTTRTLKHRIESKKSRQLKSAKDNIMGESNKKLVNCKCHKCKKHLNIDPITLHIIKEEKRKQKELEKYKRTINNKKLKEYSKEKYKKLMNYFEHYIDHSNYACNICNCHTPVFGLPPFCFLPVNISDIPKIQSILENNHDEESNISQISVRDQGLRNSAESNHSQVPILIEPKDEEKPYVRQYLQLPSTKSKEIDKNKKKKELSDNSMSGVEIDYPSERPPTNLIPKSKVEGIRNDSEHKLVQEENINIKKSPIVEDQNTSILSWFESWFSNNKTDLKSNEKSKISSKLRSQTKISLKNGYKKTAENLKINSKERKNLSLKKTTLAPMKVISIEKKEVADNDTKSIQNNLMNKYNDVSTDPIEEKTNTKLEIKENTKSDTFHEVLETPRLGMNSNTKIERSILSIKHDILTEKGEEISSKIAQKSTTSKGVHNENKQITEFSVDSNPVVLRHSQELVDKLVPSPEHSREVMTEMKSPIEPKNEPEHPKGDIINLDKKIYLRKIGQFIPEKKQGKVSKEDCNLNQTEVDYSKDSNELKENLISKEITNKDSRSNENPIESNTLEDSISKLKGNKEVPNNINVLDKAPALVSNVNTTPINTNNSSDLSTKVCVNTDENILSKQISNANVKKKQNSLKKVNVRKSIDKISRKKSLNQENQDVGYFTSWFSSWFSGGATQETNKLSNSKAQDNLVKDTKDIKNHKVVENIAIPTGNNETSIAKDTNKAVSTNEGLSNREADNKNISVNIAAVSISSKNLALGEIVKGDFNDKKTISRTSNMNEKPEIPATLKNANNTNKEVTNEIVLEGISGQSKISSKTIEPFIKSVEVTNINAPITTKNYINKTGIFKEGATTKSSKEINKSGTLKRSTSSTTESEPTSWFPGLFNESTFIISDINQTESISKDLKSTEEIRSTVAVPASTEGSTSWFSNWFETSKTENIDTNKSEIKTKNFKTSENSLSTEASPVIENSTSWFSDWFGGYTNKSTPIKKSSHRTRSVKATIKKKGTDMKELQPKPKQIQKIVRNKTKSSIIPQSKVSASPPPPKISTKFNKEDSEIKSKSIKDQQYTQNNSWWYGSNTESNTSPADNSTPWFGGLFGTGEASDKTQTTVNNGQDNAVSSTDNSSTWYSGLFGGTTQPTVITDGEKNQVQGEISSASSSKSSEKKVVKATISEQVSNPEPETATTSMWGWFGGTTATTQDSTVAVDKPQEQEGGGVSSSWYSAFGW